MATPGHTAVVFPFRKPATDPSELLPASTIKWKQVNTLHEIHAPTLATNDLSILVPHCLNIKLKIIRAVHTAAHLGPSLFTAFPRTSSEPLEDCWKAIVIGMGDTKDKFDNVPKLLISSHTTRNAQHALVHQLSRPVRLTASASKILVIV